MSAVIDRSALQREANLAVFLRASRMNMLVGSAMVLAGVSLLLFLLSDVSVVAAIVPLAGIVALLWQSSESKLLMAPAVLMVTAVLVTLSPLFTTVHPFTFAVALVGLSVAMAGLVSIGQGAVTRYTCTRAGVTSVTRHRNGVVGEQTVRRSYRDVLLSYREVPPPRG